MFSLTRIPSGAALGLVLTILFLAMAILAPVIAPYPMDEIVGDVWQPGSAAHWLGTDNLGRDLLARIIYWARSWVSRRPSPAAGSTR